ncbi:MAG: hypothetical protein ABFC90_03470 [Bacteroidales bacterium]|nr:hypothetical protein [Bacteroidales bacterium]MDD3906679.1 hypothetical protein [Bacteroidales bacterium]MDD4712901.1 hypothetical protein [Bacteroidales bacterium]
MITFFLQQKIKKISDRYVRDKKFREYKDIHQVMLFFNMEDLEVVKTFADALIADGKQVIAYTYDSGADKLKPPKLPDRYKILTKKSLNCFCFPHNDVISAFSKYSADTLIDLTVRPSLILKYLFLNSSSDFRVGFNRENGRLYDLLIERNEEQDFTFFVNQMLFYMKSLRTK